MRRSRPDVHDDPSTELLPRAEMNAAPAARYQLLVTEGPDQGKRFEVAANRSSRVYLGQSPKCELELKDRAASRRHLALEVTPHGLHLTDLGSTNGTRVNGAVVVDGFLRGGETIRVGDTVVSVALSDEPLDVPLSSSARFGRLVGASVAMRRLYPLCERLAASDVSVIVEGETGTGKEILAEALHEAGPRAGGPFVVFDCTAVPASLLESALFGHDKGAFTGAVASRRGVFELAHGGTLLIDEIGELETTLQPKLLRAIERSEVQRVGSERWLRVDVRILAATRRDLEREVAAGRFREDLFFRLAVARLELPPLRARAGDISMLARYFWRMLGSRDEPLPEALLTRYEDYAWPGNVRELKNAVAGRLALGDLARPLGASSAASADVVSHVLALDLPLTRARQLLVEEFERRYVDRVLERHGGNVTRAAAASGIARRYFSLLKTRRGSRTEE